MKKLVILSFLSLLFCQATFAQKRYDRWWKQVENYEIDGKSKSALEGANYIYKKAKAQNKDRQFVKAFLYKAKYELILKKDIRQSVYQNFKDEIAAQKTPVKQILSSILAESLSKYFHSNRYKIRKRSSTSKDSLNTDFETWNSQTFLKHILRLYENSLENPEKLRQLQDEDYTELLTYGENYKTYQTSLYDLLARRYLSFLKKSRLPYLAIPQISVPWATCFAPPQEFANLNLATKKPESRELLMLQLFQEVEKAHLDDKDKRGLLSFALLRLEFMRNSSLVKDADAKYFKALQNLKTEFTGNKERAWIAYKLAEFYQKQADKKQHPDFYKRAIAQAQKSLKLVPKGLYSPASREIIRHVGRTQFSVKTKKYILPEKKDKALVEFRNTDSLHMAVYAVDLDFHLDHKSKDSVLKTHIENKRPKLQKDYALPVRKDHYKYSTEILLPALSNGRYVLLFSEKASPNLEEDFYNYQFLQATDLAYVKLVERNGNSSYLLTDRTSGKPLENVKAEVTPKTGEKGRPITATSDKNGFVKFNPQDDFDSKRRITFSKAGDSLHVRNFKFGRGHEPEKDNAFDSHLLTDRGIYRPGQTVFFKGILSFVEGKTRKVADSAKVKMILLNTHYDAVEIKRFETNAFGSFNGKFELPKSGLNGDYYLRVKSDFEEGAKWYPHREDFDSERISFKVEEYKRPTFEVEMDSLQDTYVLGDTIELTGKAEAFFGGNLSNSKVHYTVERKFPYNPLYRRSQAYSHIKDFRIKSGETKTDGSGQFKIEFPALPDSTVAKRFKPVFNYVIKVDVTDINGETRSAKKTIEVGYHNARMAVLVSEMVKIGQKQNIKLVSKDLNARKIKASGVLKLYRYKKRDRVFKKRPWKVPEIQSIPETEFRTLFPYQIYDEEDLKASREKTLVNQFRYANQTEKSIALDSLENLENGRYLAKFKGKGPKGFPLETEQRFQLTNPKETPGLPNRFLKFSTDLKPNKNNTATLTVTFSTPLEELYVLAELAYNRKSQWQKLIHLKKGETKKTIELPAKAKYLFLQTTFIKANTFQKLYQKIPHLQQPENKLHFETEHFTDKLKPGHRETWKFKVLDKDDQAVSAEVLASMYDESLDDFVSFNWRLDLRPTPHLSMYNSGLTMMRFYGNSGENYTNTRNRPSLRPFYKTKINFTKLKMFGYHFTHTNRANRNYLKLLKLRHKAEKESGKTGYGTVFDSNGLPLPGVNIIVEGTNRRTQTDFDGNFYIKADKGDMLRFSYVGFKDKQLKVTAKPMAVTLNESLAVLEAVTISHGYQTVAKNTKAVTTVTAEDIEDKSNAEIINELQGQVAGLSIGGNSGESGAGKTITLRGVGAMNGNVEPLFVVDGVPVEESEYRQIQANSIANVNVLKGPAATSIYGNRGKNGVVVISTKKGAEELENIKPRKNLQETAFFFPELTTDKKGTISFSFDSPEALTRWKFQAFAHSKTLQQGSLKLNTVTQKDLNIIPNFPRFFRSGDTVVISTKINNLSKKGLSGIAKLQFTDEITQKNVELITDKNAVKNFQLKSKGNTEVRWKMAVPEGLSAVRYKITAKAGNFTDGETNVIPVLSNRIFITESLPIWVKPGEEKSFTLENLKENKSKSLENHRLIFDYTANPAWTALRALPYLMEFPHDCAEQVFARYYANTLSQKILEANAKIAERVENWQNNDSLKTALEKNGDLKNTLLEESPWLKTAQSRKAQQKRLADLLDNAETTKKAKASLVQLREMQLPSGGFPWFKGGRENIAVSTHILSGLGRLGKPKTGQVLQQNYTQITKKLVEFLDEAYSEKHRDKTGKKVYSFGNSGLHYLYARRLFGQKEELFKAYQKKALVHYQDNWLQLDLQEKIVLALVAADSDKIGFAKKILVSLKENAVINSETGMYWKENSSGFGWHQDPIETQALAIEAFSKIDNDKKSVNALKTWLLKQKQTQAWKSTKATTNAVYALLLKGDDLLSENASPQIKIGNEKLDFDSTEGKTGYFKKEYKPKEISSEKATVHVENNSKTPQFGGLYWQYFEDSDKVEQANLAELQMKKELFVNQESSEGKTLVPIGNRKLKVGDLITVRLTIKAKTDFDFMHLKDMRAAGLEPVDVISKYRHQDGLGYYQSTKDVATHFFFDRLPKGVYVFEYELRVNNPGGFSNGITRLQSMYAPEFSVQSRGSRVEFKSE